MLKTFNKLTNEEANFIIDQYLLQKQVDNNPMRILMNYINNAVVQDVSIIKPII